MVDLELKTHDKRPWSLSEAIRRHPLTILVSYRGHWCPGCNEQWEGLSNWQDRFRLIGAEIYGVSADRPKNLRKMRKKHDIQWTFLSDPKLRMSKELDVRTQDTHPMSATYPKGAFLQPSVFIFTQDGVLRWSWRAKSKASNLYGAIDRPKPKDIMEEAKKALDSVARQDGAQRTVQPGVAP